MQFLTTPEFDRDFKKLAKKFRTLDSDFALLKKYIEGFHTRGIRADDPVEIPGACDIEYKSYKVRKITCKSLPGRGNKSGLRVIYVYEITKDKITFIEMCNRIIEIKNIDGIILGCTELPLMIKQDDFKIKVIDTMDIHIKSILEKMV